MKSKEENMLFMLQNAIGGETFEECLSLVRKMKAKRVEANGISDEIRNQLKKESESPDPELCDNQQNHPRLCHCNEPVYWKKKAEHFEKLQDELSSHVGKALLAATLAPGDIIKEESDHAIVAAVIDLQDKIWELSTHKQETIPEPTQEEIEFCVNHSHDKKVIIQTADLIIRSFVHMRNNPKEKDPRIKVVQIWLAEEPAGGPNSSYVDAEELLRRLDELSAEVKQ